MDYLLQQAKVEGQIDLLHYAQLMRSFRVNMIQTWVNIAVIILFCVVSTDIFIYVICTHYFYICYMYLL